MAAHASGARTDLFEEARKRASVEDVVRGLGLKLRRQGKAFRSSCPLCGAGQGSGSIFEIKGEGEHQRWRCFGCERRGDVVDLVAEVERLTVAEAARRLAGREYQPKPRAEAQAKAQPSGPSASDRIAREIWREAGPFAGTLGETYLRRRGIDPNVIARASEALRFHPNTPHSWDERSRTWVRAPAMVAQVVTEAGPTGGVHVTYLDRATAGKARLTPAKRMWGPQTDADGRPGGAWLIGPIGVGPLVESEGIETGLSVASLELMAGRVVRVLAALSLNRMQGGFLRDADGCVDPNDLKPDPERPALTWTAPEACPWPGVLIAVARDMGDIKVKARTGRGKVCDMVLGAEARARVCGRLAVAAWKATGAAQVRAIAPPPGSDFNDELRRRLARESVQ